MITRGQLSNARKCCGYNQERFAAALGYSLSYYEKIEAGERDVPDVLDSAYLIDKIENYHNSVVSTLTVILSGNFVKP